MIISITLIKLAVVLHMIVFGIHQFTRPNQWFGLLPRFTRDMYNVEPKNIIRTHAIASLTLAVIFISGIYPLFFAWVVFFWWISTLPFIFMWNWQNGLRDLVTALSLLALIYLIM